MRNKRSTPIKGKASSGSKRAAKSAPVLLNRDFWDEEGNRYLKGSIVNVEVATAKKLIEGKKAERADPLPGEVAPKEAGQ